MSLRVAVFSGHTKSVAATLRNNRICRVASGDSLNPHAHPFFEIGSRLDSLLSKVITPRAAGALDRLVLALPGAAAEIDQHVARLALRFSSWGHITNTTIADDTWVGLTAGLLRTDGMCAFAGTGASVFVNSGEFPQGKNGKVDGWGPVLGDHGSGFELSVNLLRKMLREIDGGKEPSLVAEVSAVEPRIRGVTGIQPWFDSLLIVRPADWRVRFASIASAVTQAADRSTPDPLAVELLDRAAGRMTETISFAINRYGPQSANMAVAFQGGMFEYSKHCRPTV